MDIKKKVGNAGNVPVKKIQSDANKELPKKMPKKVSDKKGQQSAHWSASCVGC